MVKKTRVIKKDIYVMLGFMEQLTNAILSRHPDVEVDVTNFDELKEKYGIKKEYEREEERKNESIELLKKIESGKVISFELEDRLIVKVPKGFSKSDSDKVVDIVSKWANISKSRILIVQPDFEIDVLRKDVQSS